MQIKCRGEKADESALPGSCWKEGVRVRLPGAMPIIGLVAFMQASSYAIYGSITLSFECT
jgi:hypothetical protein